MAKLTVEQRRRLTKKAFACPTTRDYPINDPSRVSSARAYYRRGYTKKCKGGKTRICRAARKFGFMKSGYKGASSWKKWCRR